MKTVIMARNKYSESIKYLLIDEEERICLLVQTGKTCLDQEDETVRLIRERLGCFKIEILPLPPLQDELKLLKPQIIKEFKEKFPYVNGWLERARFRLEDRRKLVFEVENEVALKNLNKLKGFLKRRLFYYLGEELEVQIKNGDFLEKFNEDTSSELLDKLKNGNGSSGDGEVVFGRKINRPTELKLAEIRSEREGVIVEGRIFELEEIRTRKGSIILVIQLTDGKSSLTLKLFLGKKGKLTGQLKEEDWIRASGSLQYDRYSGELTLILDGINKIPPPQKKDAAEEKRVELHLHTKMSAMDSVVDVQKAVQKAAEWGHPALAITDHGVVQAFPEAYRAGKKYGVKIIFGMEAYLVDDGRPVIINPPAADLQEVTYTVFDLETTGLKSDSDEIIEIGAVRVREGIIEDEFSTFIKPQREIPAKITEITGINGEMVSDAPLLAEGLSDFLEFCRDTVLVAHNSAFDYGFLRKALEETGLDEGPLPVFDTLELSRKLFPDLKNHKLITLSQKFSIGLEKHHRAVNDALATAGVFLKMMEKLKEKGVESVEAINSLGRGDSWRDLPVYHLIVLARNRQGLQDLYRLVSSSHLEHFYRRPRILKTRLMERRENLLIGSACEAGQLYRAILEKKSSRVLEREASFYDFLEIQPIGNNRFLIGDHFKDEKELQETNRKIYQLGKKINRPVVATGDVHFLDPEDEIFRRILQSGQGYDMSSAQPPLYYRTTGEMLEEFSYLGEEAAREVVVENTRVIADLTEELAPIPDGLFTPKIEGAAEQIRQLSYQRAYELYGNPLPEFIEKRLERELKSIIENGFAVIYLIAHKLVKKSLDDGYLVGSRGSVGSSLVAMLCEITEVNPLPPHYRCPACKQVEFVKKGGGGVDLGIDLPDQDCPGCGNEYEKEGFDIPFEVFMGFKGDKVPDIDLNFSGEYQGQIHRYTEELFGRDYVFRAGTISTIASRTAFGFVKGYLDDNSLQVNKAEIKRLVQGCTGVRKTTGQHPGGLMVVPRHQDIHDFTPIQHPANDQETDIRTTHFDYHAISGRILKLDLLGHDDPTSLRMLQDLTGLNPHDIPLDDPDTMAIFSSTETIGVTPEEIGSTVGSLGIPEFGTVFVRQMLLDTNPTTFSELVRISGLSHGTDVWLNNAQELIRSGRARLAEVISVRDDIMNYLLEKGLDPGRAFRIMENVRKGRGLSTDEEEYMREQEVPSWYIDSCKKIKYMFPKAHAAAYVMMAYRIAYFKVHYPAEFYATYFSTKAADFDADMVNLGYEELVRYKEELDGKGNEATAKEKGIITVLEMVIEAMARGVNFKRVDLYRSDVSAFKIDDNGLLPPLISLQGLGSSAASNIVSTRGEGKFTSIEDLVNRTHISKTVVEIMQKHGTLTGLPEKNQLSLF